MDERETAGRSVWKGRLIEMPFAFTGMGLFRAWTETVYSNGAIAFPAQDETGFGFAAFNMIAAAVLIVLLASLLPLWMLGPVGGELASFCALAAYTFVLIVIMVVLSDLTYQYGFNAVWLFGIERAVRLVSVQVGLAATEALTEPSFGYLVLCAVVAVAVVVATALFLSEKQLTTPWGTVLKTLSGQSFGDRSRIGAKCDELSEQFGLTSREAEILALLVQGKQQGQIAQDLYIAPSTVKTHIKHLYQKLGVHSRKGLCDLVGVEAGRAGCEK